VTRGLSSQLEFSVERQVCLQTVKQQGDELGIQYLVKEWVELYLLLLYTFMVNTVTTVPLPF